MFCVENAKRPLVNWYIRNGNVGNVLMGLFDVRENISTCLGNTLTRHIGNEIFYLVSYVCVYVIAFKSGVIWKNYPGYVKQWDYEITSILRGWRVGLGTICFQWYLMRRNAKIFSIFCCILYFYSIVANKVSSTIYRLSNQLQKATAFKFVLFFHMYNNNSLRCSSYDSPTSWSSRLGLLRPTANIIRSFHLTLL